MNPFHKLDHIQGIGEQGYKVHIVPNTQLSGTGNDKFNGSILEFKGVLYIAYRARDPRNKDRYNIALHEITKPWEEKEVTVRKGGFLDLPGIGSEGIFEDCRLFEFKGKLWMSYCEVILPHGRDGMPIYPRLQIPIHVVRFDENLKVDHHIKIKYGLNFAEPKAVEKNWTFFDYNEKLHFCYGGRKNTVVRVDHESGNVIEKWSHSPIDWPHGKFRGGTCPILDNGSYLCFIHNSGDHAWLERRYTLSAYRFKAKPPFGIISASRVPMIYGSGREPYCGKGNGRCIFPMGAEKRNGIWYVSCGINDTCNYIVEIPEEKVEENMVSIDYFNNDPWTYWEGKALKPFVTSWGKETPWRVWKTSGKDGNLGLYRTADPFAIEELNKLDWVTQLTREEYDARLNNTTRAHSYEERDKKNIMSGRGGRSAE